MTSKNYSCNFRGIFRGLCSLFLLIGLWTTNSFGQIDVTATGGTLNASYTTLGAAFTAINGGTHTGTITIGVSGNTNEGVTVATLNASGSGSASYTTITIQPTGGAARNITGAPAGGSPMIDLNGADNVTFDGLNTGSNSLTIENSTVSATSGTSTIRFIGGATNNTITNCSVKGAFSGTVATNGGNIFFSTDAVTANGNDNNTISNCDIGPSGANLPTKGILGNGSATTTAIGNSGIIINNNNIFDYFGAAVTSSGIAINGGCNAWTITNNRFYQTGTRTWTTGTTHRAIDLNSSAANSGVQGCTVTGNIIGYASKTQTGTYLLTGSAGKFQGIFFSGITAATTSDISTNTVASVSLTGVTSSGTTTTSPFAGILVGNGVTTCNSNIIGSQSSTGSLTFSTTTTAATDVYGMGSSSANAWTSNSNQIGGMSITNAGASGAFIVNGIRCSAVAGQTWTASTNLVGGTVANSIQLICTSTSAQIIGMNDNTPACTLTSNTVRNMIMNAANIGTGINASLIGILISNISATSGNTVGQNQVYALTNSSSAASLRISGIVYSGSATGIHVVERNLVYDLDAGGASTTLINGIDMAAGTTTYKNNMIRLGTFGTSASTGMVLQAFNENAGTPTNNLIFNSVYIGGNPTTGTGNSFGLNNAINPTSARLIENNIFYNARSTGGTATGKNYAVRLNAITNNTIDYNDYYVTGTGGNVGLFAGADKLDLTAWKASTLQDVNSKSVDPGYNNPTAAGASLNLHITTGVTPNSLESGGVAVAGAANDYDNDVRPGPAGSVNGGGTVPDIGADEFDGTPNDGTPPIISYTTTIPPYACGAITLSASITDASGVPQSAPGLPVVWWKIGVGGTYTPATGTWTSGSNYNFTFGTGATAGQTIYFYLVARDNSPAQNIAVLPSAGASGPSTVDPISVSTPPTSPNSYLFSGILSGTKTIGSSGDYPTIGDAINAYNTSCLGGALIFELIDNSYSEVNAVTINNHIDASALNTLTIRPASSISSPVIFTTANGTANFDLNGAKYVTIDGRPGGTGANKYLIIENTSATAGSAGNAILVRNESRNNLITYCEVRSANSNAAANTSVFTIPGGVPGAIAIGTTAGANGNDNNAISYCDIHSLSSGGNLGVGVFAYNANPAGTAANNDNNTIDSCNIYDFYLAGTASAGINISLGNNNWTITNNSIYQTGSRTYSIAQTVRSIWIIPNTASLTSASGFIINNNYVGGTATACGGSAMTMTCTAATGNYIAMDISVGTGAATSMQANTIANINMTTANASTSSFVGYNIANGNVNVGTVTGNLFGSTTSTTGSHSITFTTSVTLGGVIPFRSVAGGTINFANNTAAGIDLFASATSIAPSFTGISVAGGTTVNVTNDTIGSSTIPNSINLVSTSSTSTSASVCRGITVSAGTTTTVSGNLIANINSNYSATGLQLNSLGGITVSASTSSVTGNTIRNLTSATQTTGSGASSGIIGIAQTTTSAGITVSRNTIHSLRLTNSGLAAGAQITGIFIGGPTTGTNVVSRNNIHSLSLASSTNTASTFTGITVSTGTTNYTNNMIRLGYDESGNEITAGIQLRGITKGAPNANNFYHNSIFIGGTNVISSALNSFAFQRSIAPSATPNDDIRDNIFVNNRSNLTTGGKHYVFSAIQNTLLTLNNNVYYFNGTGGVFALNITTPVPSYITNWLPGDANSYPVDPLYINPTGSAVTGDLHIDTINPTIVESSGILIATVSDDFDGQTRASLTPTDIGADAGNFANLVCNGAPTSSTAIYSGNTNNICVSGTKTLTLSNFPSTPGLILQWQESATPGGPYTNVTGGSGATTITFTTPTITQTMYYICLVTCVNGGLSTPSSEKAVVVDNPQVLTTTPGTTCGPGTVTLSATASAGASISWFTALTGGSALSSFPYLNIPVTGFNNDVVANGVGDGTNGTTLNTSSTGNMNGMVTQPGVGMDGSGNTFIDGTYKWYTGSTLPACFLPASGQIPSALTSGLTYQLKSYSGLNALTIESNTYGGSVWPTVGTVTLATPASYSTLKVLYETAQNSGGTTTITGTLTFTDATTQVITGNSFVNWMTATGVAYTPHISKAQNVAPGNPFSCAAGPYLFEMTLPVSAANYNKLIQSITFNFSSTGGSTATTVDYLHVLGVGGVVPPFMNSYTTPVIFAATPYYVQASIGSCNSTPRTLVNANYTTPPTLTLTSNQNVCVNMIAPVSVTSNLSNFSSYTWAPITNLYSDAAATIPLTALDNLTTVYFKSSTVGSNSVTATATGGGCTNIVSTSVSTIAGPAVTITTTPNAVCPGGNIQLNAVAAGTNTYNWAANPTLSATNISNPVAQNIQSTQTYSVTVTAASSGCSTTQTVSAFVNEVPDPSFSNNDGPKCEGSSLTLDGINTGAGQTTTGWLWSGPSFSSTSEDFTFNPATLANNGTYTLTITNNFGCTASITMDVTVNPNPILSIGTQTNVSCNGLSTGYVDLDVTSGTPGYLFDLDGNTSGNGIYNGLSAGPYTANVTDVNGCSSTSLTVTITEPPVLTVGAGSNTPVCSGTTLNLSATPAGGTSGYSYAWTGPNGPIPSVQNPTIASATIADAGNYSVQVTDANSCVATSSNHLVQVNASPTAAIALVGSPDKCLGQSATVQVIFTGTGPWNYTISGSGGPYSGTAPTSPANINVIPTAIGTQTYTVTAVGNTSCPSGGTATGSAIVFVSTTPPPSSGPVPVGPAEACANSVILITTNAVVGQNIRYSWNTGSNSSTVLFSTNIGGPFSPGPFQTTANQVYAQFGALGGGQSGYQVCMQSVNGCGSSINKCLWIRGTVSGPGPITPANGVVACENTTQVYSCGLSGGATVYTWTLNGLTAPITPNGGNNPTNVSVAFPSGFTTGQLCVTAALACGGSSTSPARCMTINKNPANPNVPTGAATVCPGAPGVSYSIPAVPGASGYSWTVPANATIATGANSPSITVNFPTPYTGSSSVCVTTTSACGASAVKCKTVASGIPNQPAGITGPLTNVCGSTVQYSVVNPIASSYTWTSPAGTTISGQGGSTIQLAVSPTFTSGSLTVVANSAMCPPGTSAPRTSSTIWGRPNTPGAITANPAMWCSGGYVNFSVTPAAPLPTYNWTVSNGTIDAGNGNNNIDVTWGANAAGTVSVRASNGCGLSAGTSSQSFSSGCREEGINTSSATDFSVYPNPAHDKVTVSIYVKEQAQFNVKLRDMSGRVILSEDHEGAAGLNAYDMDLKGFAKGIYTIEIQSAKDSWKTKVIIE